MKEVCVNCMFFQNCDDTTDNCENEGCACFEPLTED